MTIDHTMDGRWEAWDMFLLALAAYLLWFLSGWLKAVRLSLKLSGPPALPLLGNVLLISDHKRLMELGTNSYQEYGKLFRVWITIFPMFVVQTPEDVQAILSSQKHTEKIYIYNFLHNFLGQGLITSSGDAWRSHRKLIQPSFHNNILEEFICTFSECAQDFVGKLKATGPEGINITNLINECVLDIMNAAVLGIPVNHKASGDKPQESPYRKGEVLVQYRITRPWLIFSWIYRLTDLAKRELEQKNNLLRFTKQILEERRRKMAKKETANSLSGASEPSKSRKCLLDYLVGIGDKNKYFTDDDIINEICTFMLAGQDSVGAAVAFALFLLAQHPDAQERAVEELDSIFNGSSRTPTRHDLAAMRYLEQCIKEALRLYPSVPIVARRLGDEINMGKHTLPAGSEVIISPFAIHRLPHIYPEPEKFDPNRFSLENVQNRNSYAFIPFSAGPRNCIGYKFALMEMKTVVSTLLRKYHLKTVRGKDQLQLKYRITLRAKGGIWLQLTPRTERE